MSMQPANRVADIWSIHMPRERGGGGGGGRQTDWALGETDRQTDRGRQREIDS